MKIDLSAIVIALTLSSGCSLDRRPAVRGGDSARVAATASGPLAVRYDQHVFAGALPPPGDTSVHNPSAGHAKAATEGQKLFNSMNCDGCHGGAGEGWVAPSLNDGRWRYGGSDAAVFQTIFYGRPRGMPAFGGMLSRDAIWLLVTYIRSLPPSKAVPTQVW